MNKILKRVIALFFIIVLTFSPVFAGEKVKLVANVVQGFNAEIDSDEIYFKTIKKAVITKDLIIPQRSIVTAQIYETQKERRWHKSGFIVGKLTSYLPELETTSVDISNKDIFILIKKYEPINKKEASILATEIILTQGASFFAPGVDILYFFTKGAIQREKHQNWFKAGVFNAYENSICWFWLKGKPIDLKENEAIRVINIDELKALKLTNQVDIRKQKQNLKAEIKQNKRDLKEFEHETKQANKKLENSDIGSGKIINNSI